MRKYGGHVTKGMSGKRQLITGAMGRAVPIAIRRNGNVCEKWIVGLLKV
jgi:hypothetical protein